MNIAQVKIYDAVFSLTHDILGDIILKGNLTSKKYSFLNMVGAQPGDTVVISVRNTVMYGLVTDIERDAQPKDVISDFFKPILSIVSNQKVQEYYRLRHLYRQTKQSGSNQYDPTAYTKALDTVERERFVKRLAKNMSEKLSAEKQRREQLRKEQEEQARHQLYVEAAARKVAEEQARLEEQIQLDKLAALLKEVMESVKLLRSKGITFKNI